MDSNSLRGADLLAAPPLNKDSAFTEEERDRYGLRGLLPCGVATIDQQVALELERLRRKSDDLEKYIGLAALQDRNETLFHRVLLDHLEELAPVVYTPTVGEACRWFSHVMRRPRGLWVTPDDIERILGLGDQGAGGMGIPIGKLALYTAGAGLHPSLTLPVSLDCGTDNEELLGDSLYLGYPKPRLRGAAYDAFIEAFVDAVLDVFPDAVLQWEDFKQHNAIRLLDRYRHRVASFNDDIQGTAAVVVAGLLAGVRARDESLSQQRLVFVGAGAAGIGIARLVDAVVATEAAGARPTIVMLDSQGLIFEGRAQVHEDKRPFALPAGDLARFGFAPADRYDLETVVRQIAPTILVGTSAVAGAFTETAIREMAARTSTPLVFPLSNPTANSEAKPADVFTWSEGRAIVATGSPFDPVDVDGRTRLVGQANNVFVFPGVGLGAIVVRAREVPDRMFLGAATTLAERVSAERRDQGALYPPLSALRPISRAIAVSVAREARDSGVARIMSDEQIELAIDAAMWMPEYHF